MVGAVAGGRRSEVRFVNRVITRGNVLLPSMGWYVEGRGRDGRRRWSGTDGVRGAVGGGRRRTDVGGGWFMVGNGVSPYSTSHISTIRTHIDKCICIKTKRKPARPHTVLKH